MLRAVVISEGLRGLYPFACRIAHASAPTRSAARRRAGDAVTLTRRGGHSATTPPKTSTAPPTQIQNTPGFRYRRKVAEVPFVGTDCREAYRSRNRVVGDPLLMDGVPMGSVAWG